MSKQTSNATEPFVMWQNVLKIWQSLFKLAVIFNVIWQNVLEIWQSHFKLVVISNVIWQNVLEIWLYHRKVAVISNVIRVNRAAGGFGVAWLTPINSSNSSGKSLSVSLAPACLIDPAHNLHSMFISFWGH